MLPLLEPRLDFLFLPRYATSSLLEWLSLSSLEDEAALAWREGPRLVAARRGREDFGLPGPLERKYILNVKPILDLGVAHCSTNVSYLITLHENHKIPTDFTVNAGTVLYLNIKISFDSNSLMYINCNTCKHVNMTRDHRDG